MTINLSKLEKAITLQGNNQLDIAEKIYEDILASDGKDFNALYLLGTIKAQKNKNKEAILLIKLFCFELKPVVPITIFFLNFLA